MTRPPLGWNRRRERRKAWASGSTPSWRGWNRRRAARRARWRKGSTRWRTESDKFKSDSTPAKRPSNAAMQAIGRQQPSAAPEAAPCPPFTFAADDWQAAFLGRDLAEGPALDAQRRRLLDGVREGDPAASALIGFLLLFRAAAPEKMSALLKDIGEAYYRWRPHLGGAADDMEQALVASLLRTCEQAGISNTIELVHPGERFDAVRAQRRGAGRGSRPAVGLDRVARQRQGLHESQRRRKIRLRMNTFQCTNCGAQIQRPAQPYSCPQCGRQAVGLFRLLGPAPPGQPAAVRPGQGVPPSQTPPGVPGAPAWPWPPQGIAPSGPPVQPIVPPPQPPATWPPSGVAATPGVPAQPPSARLGGPARGRAPRQPPAAPQAAAATRGAIGSARIIGVAARRRTFASRTPLRACFAAAARETASDIAKRPGRIGAD